jgi:PII-like signaling protein
MRTSDGEQVLVRIFTDGDNKRPFVYGLVLALQEQGFPSALVTRASNGFGLATPEKTADAPVLIEVIAGEGEVARLLSLLEERLPAGLVTIDKVRAVRFAPAQGQ